MVRSGISLLILPMAISSDGECVAERCGAGARQVEAKRVPDLVSRKSLVTSALQRSISGADREDR